MSVVWASAKASAESERMKRLRIGWGRACGIPSRLANRTRGSVLRGGCLSARGPAESPRGLSARPRPRPGQGTGTTAAERAPAAAPQVPAALALQRKIGNRAFGQLIARATPEESVEMLDPAINGAHVDVEQISRTFLPFSKDQEGFDKMAEAYEKKMETPLKGALESRLGARTCSRSRSACRGAASRRRRTSGRRRRGRLTRRGWGLRR